MHQPAASTSSALYPAPAPAADQSLPSSWLTTGSYDAEVRSALSQPPPQQRPQAIYAPPVATAVPVSHHPAPIYAGTPQPQHQPQRQPVAAVQYPPYAQPQPQPQHQYAQPPAAVPNYAGPPPVAGPPPAHIIASRPPPAARPARPARPPSVNQLLRDINSQQAALNKIRDDRRRARAQHLAVEAQHRAVENAQEQTEIAMEKQFAATFAQLQAAIAREEPRRRRSPRRERDRDRRDRRDYDRDRDSRRMPPPRRRAPRRKTPEEEARDQARKEEEERTRDQRTVFVSQLQVKCNRKDIRHFMEKAGKVNEVTLITDKITGRSKGFAYVEMRTLTDVPKALALDGEKFEFRNGKVGFAVKIKASEAEKNIVEKPTTVAVAGGQPVLAAIPSASLTQRFPLSAPIRLSSPLVSPLMSGGVTKKRKFTE